MRENMGHTEQVALHRRKLGEKKPLIGSWMQIPDPSVAEIMGRAGYDWVAVDMEHGSICVHQLPDLFRAIELGGTLPMARLAQGHPKDCKQALDAGAGGVIIPMVESADQLRSIRNACCWPPAGTRGVGFSRANLFGKNFDDYAKEAQAPLLVAMIEHEKAVASLPEILAVEGLDAIMIGPYDLSASMGLTGDFSSEKFIGAMETILSMCQTASISCGIHVVQPCEAELHQRIEDGYRFIAYCIDAVFLSQAAQRKI